MSPRTPAERDDWDRFRKADTIVDYFRVNGAPAELQAIFDDYLAQAEAIHSDVPSNASLGRARSARLQALLAQRDREIEGFYDEPPP